MSIMCTLLRHFTEKLSIAKVKIIAGVLIWRYGTAIGVKPLAEASTMKNLAPCMYLNHIIDYSAECTYNCSDPVPVVHAHAI